MTHDALQYDKTIELTQASLVMGLSGWMNGGEVSTGVVEYLVRALEAEPFARIVPDDFYLYSFPGTMEFAALLRPHCKIEDGLVCEFDEPENRFWAAVKPGLILFSGKEPNLLWNRYAESLLEVCRRHGVRRIVFVGSVAGLTPHTREPRVLCSVSERRLRDELEPHGMQFSRYAGPASFVTYLTLQAERAGVEMISLVAEIPAYVQGYNPRCVEAAVRHVGALLGLQLPLGDLRNMSEEFEKRLDVLIAEQPELLEKIKLLEADYDDQVFDNEMGDLKLWLQRQGIRVD